MDNPCAFDKDAKQASCGHLIENNIDINTKDPLSAVKTGTHRQAMVHQLVLYFEINKKTNGGDVSKYSENMQVLQLQLHHNFED